MTVRSAIQACDTPGLLQLLAADPAQANALIGWGDGDCIQTHPLHYISDMIFEQKLDQSEALPLLNALIAARADLDFQRNGKGDTPLIGAASLGAEDVGLRLLDAGAKADPRGIFGETALHWAALLGEDRLAARLIPISDVNLKDDRYKSSTLGWAVHGWLNPPAGNCGRQREVAALLVSAGAAVQPEWLESEQIRGDPQMLDALTLQRRQL